MCIYRIWSWKQVIFNQIWFNPGKFFGGLALLFFLSAILIGGEGGKVLVDFSKCCLFPAIGMPLYRKWRKMKDNLPKGPQI